ncbi:MAG TPA: DUF721 domain-containing protein [Candidatus Acidoferrales bacterium]|nr:DUF721 domain-containing protein [Candidatus Acidoferrales bacterium]
MTTGPQRLLRHLGGRSESATLIARAAVLAQQSERLRAHLPEPLDQHCVLANVRGDTAVLAADSAAWASRLRYLAPALLPRLVDLGLSVTRVEVVVMPPPALPAKPTPRRVCPPSAEIGRALAAWAARAPDEALSRALLKLAARSKS